MYDTPLAMFKKVEIDTQWNVNVIVISLEIQAGVVEIDTQWNVNNEVRNKMAGGLLVEIDTQWNVNH